ncbi:MBL fold metallo-hydrolase [Candidatus Saccharibacteria bacterium]|nr:MBL fold metallo-hydrolase [Candidatus Saccharibacteria bacterium]
MKLTKYEHSCVVLEKDGENLVIDAGPLSESYKVPDNCVAIVVTHEHFDHLDQEKLKATLTKNQDAKLFVNADIEALLGDELKPAVVVIASGQNQTVGGFSLQFVGSRHEPIRPEVPQPVNTGVIVNELFYHPGDQYFVPEQSFTWLGLPLNAPWAKVSETTEFVKQAKAQHIVPIHNGLLNEWGMNTYESHVKAVCEMAGTEYHPIKTCESIELV